MHLHRVLFYFAYPFAAGNNNTERKRSSCSIVSRGGDTKATEEGVLVVNGENVEEDFADEQRRSMRVALARRMKHELVQSEHNRLAKVSDKAFMLVWYCQGTWARPTRALT